MSKFNRFVYSNFEALDYKFDAFNNWLKIGNYFKPIGRLFQFNTQIL
jgi:hypothetical protein